MTRFLKSLGSLFFTSEDIDVINLYRLLGTPTEAEWPGVSSLPDYKPTFPRWSRKDIGEAVPQLDPCGLDLLRQMLIYDSAKRISGMFPLAHLYIVVLRHTLPAKNALKHQYFDGFEPH